MKPSTGFSVLVHRLLDRGYLRGLGTAAPGSAPADMHGQDPPAGALPEPPATNGSAADEHHLKRIVYLYLHRPRRRARVNGREREPRADFFTHLWQDGITSERDVLDLMELYLHLYPADQGEAAAFHGEVLAHKPDIWAPLIRESETSPLTFATLEHIVRRRNAADALEDDSPTCAALRQWAYAVAAGVRTRPRRRGAPAEAARIGRGIVTMAVMILHEVFGRPYTSVVDTDDPARQSACQVIAMRLGITTDHVRTTWTRVSRQVTDWTERTDPGARPEARSRARDRDDVAT